MKHAHVDTKEDVERTFVRKLGTPIKSILYIRPANDGIVSMMNKVNDLHSIFRARSIKPCFRSYLKEKLSEFKAFTLTTVQFLFRNNSSSGAYLSNKNTLKPWFQLSIFQGKITHPTLHLERDIGEKSIAWRAC